MPNWKRRFRSVPACRATSALRWRSMGCRRSRAPRSLKRRHERALRLAGGAEGVRSAVGLKMFPNYHKPIEHWRAPSRRSLGGAAVLVYEEGRRLGLQDAIAYGLGDRRQPKFLSRRELQIAEFVTRGLTSREIAGRVRLLTPPA